MAKAVNDTEMKEPAPHVVAIIQARLGSIRFPRKVLAEFRGKPILGVMLERVSRAETVGAIVLAIPESKQNDELEAFARTRDVTVFRGSEKDVLNRYADATREAHADIVVRLTGDCPLIDWTVIDDCVTNVVNGETPFCATSLSFPDGFDVEAFKADLLFEADREATASSDREHVTPFMRRKIDSEILVVEPNYNSEAIRITLDEPEDFTVICNVLESFPDYTFSARDINTLAADSPEIFVANSHLMRNEGALMSSGQKMWKRAQQVIAGGNMLLSKRPDMHSPKKWPAYFSKAKGCKVWDLDGQEYIDFGLMGVGTNILGYAYEPVDEAVRKVISQGNLSTLNAPEEVLLAEKLCELHPWADMARFTRSGGEAGTVAVRIARAATGQDKIVFSGYHGWHDWYLAANLADDQALDDHLLPGLSSSGVPRGLTGTALPFKYNDLESLEEVVSDGGVAAIYMEVERSTPPAPGFLEGVRKIASRIGAVLVFDECTSGFRQNLGGLHMHYGVEPDIAVFGKTLGNGYAINAVIGRREVMTAARSTFISSTFWTERIGPAAALATLQEMEKTKAQDRITQLGYDIRSLWTKVSSDLGLKITFSGLPSLTTLAIGGIDPLVLKTFLSESFLDRGYLAGPAIYLALPHQDIIGEEFAEVLHELLEELASRESSGTLNDLTPDGVVIQPFQRIV